MNKPTMLSPEITVKIWNYWLANVECMPGPYHMIDTHRRKRERFKSWLWSQGGSLRAINKKFHIAAYGSDATMLALRCA